MTPFFHQRSLVREAGVVVIGAGCSPKGSTDMSPLTSLAANGSARGRTRNPGVTTKAASLRLRKMSQTTDFGLGGAAQESSAPRQARERARALRERLDGVSDLAESSLELRRSLEVGSGELSAQVPLAQAEKKLTAGRLVDLLGRASRAQLGAQ